MTIRNWRVILFLVYGLIGAVPVAVFAQESPQCVTLRNAYEDVMAAQKDPIYILRSLESLGCPLPEPPAPQDRPPNEDTPPAAQAATPPAEALAAPPSSVPPTLEARLVQLEQALAAQRGAVAVNTARLERLSSLVYSDEMAPDIQAALAATSEQLAALEQKLSAQQAEIARLSGAGNQGELLGEISSLRALLGQLDRSLAQSDIRIDQLRDEQASYRAMVGNYLDSEVVSLVAELGAGACTRVSVTLDSTDPGKIIITGAVWNEDLRRAILAIPLLSFFRVDNRLETGAVGVGCAEDFGDFQIVMNPETAAPLLADKQTAIETATSLPAASTCGQLISETNAIRTRFAMQPRGFWVRDRDGFVVACLASTQRPFVLKLATGRRDKFYILLLGDLS